MNTNVPDDWSRHHVTCRKCGARYHLSEGCCTREYRCSICKERVECGDMSEILEDTCRTCELHETEEG